jgi:DNA (cytosine-5)-methyltransferase 3A
MRKINVVSAFDGISCAMIGIKKNRIPIGKYYASEIDPYAVDVSAMNFPNIHHVGSVVHLKKENFPHIFKKGTIDLLIGGSPCQDLSIAKKGRKGLDGARSGLFYEYVRILKEIKPKYFILENVASMPTEAREMISNILGVKPILINAALVSAQTRKRLFWTNIPNVTLPEDRNILLEDIIHETRGEDFDLQKYIVKGNHLEWIKDPVRMKKKYTQINGEKAVTMMARQYANWNGQYMSVRVGKIGKGGQGDRIYSTLGKSVALSANGGGRGAKTGLYLVQRARGKNNGGVFKGKSPTMTSSEWQHNVHLVLPGDYVRKLTPVECARLQSMPDNHCKGISDSQAYRAYGNAFNADVIAHILSFARFE